MGILKRLCEGGCCFVSSPLRTILFYDFCFVFVFVLFNGRLMHPHKFWVNYSGHKGDICFPDARKIQVNLLGMR